jgi:hypothetical protein
MKLKFISRVFLASHVSSASVALAPSTSRAPRVESLFNFQGARGSGLAIFPCYKKSAKKYTVASLLQMTYTCELSVTGIRRARTLSYNSTVIAVCQHFLQKKQQVFASFLYPAGCPILGARIDPLLAGGGY